MKHIGKIRPLPKNVLVDQAVLKEIGKFNWRIASHGYVVSTQNKRQYLHRLITQAPCNMYVDHINGNKLDNRKINLRLCTRQQNIRNCTKRKNNKTGYKGVFLNPSGSFTAAITVNGKKQYLGTFKNSLQAAKKYNIGAVKYFGEFANLNEVIC